MLIFMRNYAKKLTNILRIPIKKPIFAEQNSVFTQKVLLVCYLPMRMGCVSSENNNKLIKLK